MAPYSMDLRDRVIAACDAGLESRAEIAKRFDVSTAWIRRLLQRRRELGHYGPLTTRPGRKPIFVGRLRERLEAFVAEQPDATLAELRDRTGVNCTLAAICKTLQRLEYRRKKRRCGPLSKIVPTCNSSVSSGG
ncbi:MAG TPA: IS630 transposase-related protein [Phycisphaerae bacterium]|nr:IS630 transposase-related protein [Phycisphaerae bacterium]